MSMRILFRMALGSFAVAVLTGGGCFSSDSEFVDTAGIRADFVATGENSGNTRVAATLEFGLEDLELVGGDFLTATRIDPVTMAASTRTMVDSGALFGTRYEATFAGQAKDTVFVIAFDRTATGKVSAPDSTASLPAPFSLRLVTDPVTMNPAAMDFSRTSASPLFVIWDPSGAPDFELRDQLSFSVSGPCIQTYADFIDWPGGGDALQLNAALIDAPPPNDGQTCVIEVRITLSRAGMVDPAFGGGAFVGRQVRTLSLLSRP